MTPAVPFDEMLVVHEALHDTEVAQRINDAMMEANLDFIFLILGHPMMRPDVGFIEFVSYFLVFSHSQPFNPII
jgi:hypothetical protein